MPTAEGKPGQRGRQGQRGEPGKQGARGATGARGPVGPSPSRSQIIEAVHAEFDQMKRQLQVQLERTAQMQQQLDQIQNLLRRALDKG